MIISIELKFYLVEHQYNHLYFPLNFGHLFIENSRCKWKNIFFFNIKEKENILIIVIPICLKGLIFTVTGLCFDLYSQLWSLVLLKLFKAHFLIIVSFYWLVSLIVSPGRKISWKKLRKLKGKYFPKYTLLITKQLKRLIKMEVKNTNNVSMGRALSYDWWNKAAFQPSCPSRSGNRELWKINC